MRDLLVLGISLLVSKADVLPQERHERIARAVRNRHTPRNSVHDRDSFIESGFGVDKSRAFTQCWGRGLNTPRPAQCIKRDVVGAPWESVRGEAAARTQALKV